MIQRPRRIAFAFLPLVVACAPEVQTTPAAVGSSGAGGTGSGGGATSSSGSDAGGASSGGGDVGGASSGGGGAAPTCAPGAVQCAGSTVQTCDAAGAWQDGELCPFLCSAGTCTGACVPGSGQCVETVAEICDPQGAWGEPFDCASGLGQCVGGACVGGPASCVGLATSCGPAANESCCASPVVEGGTYHSSGGKESQTPLDTISTFRMDRFEVTVGRFRKFVQGYPGNKPLPGAGEHPLIPESGWKAAWDASLSPTQAALIATLGGMVPGDDATWTAAPGANETRPINHVDWFTAFAFCAWDGGRLPTSTEWNYTAMGGDEQRIYPWGAGPLDASYAAYDCMGDGSAAQDCSFADILPVGATSPHGDGRWGQANLADGMWEWSLDSDYLGGGGPACHDCAILDDGSSRMAWGGCWPSDALHLHTFTVGSAGTLARVPTNGFRCARSL